MNTHALLILGLIAVLVTPAMGSIAEGADGPDESDSPATTTKAEMEELVARHNALVPEIKKHWQQGHDRRAYEGLQELLSVYHKIYPAHKFPAGHPNTLRCYRDLCRLSDQLNEADALLEYAQLGLEMSRQLYRPDTHPHGHLDITRMLANVGHGWLRKGVAHEARSYLLQALAMTRELRRNESVGLHPESVIDLQLSVSAAYSDEGRFPDAVRTARAALDQCRAMQEESEFGLDQVALLGRCLRRHGRALMRYGDYKTARSALTAAYDHRLHVYLARRTAREHRALIDSLIDMSILCRLESDFPNAKRHLAKAHEEMAQGAGSLVKKYGQYRRFTEQAWKVLQAEHGHLSSILQFELPFQGVSGHTNVPAVNGVYATLSAGEDGPAQEHVSGWERMSTRERFQHHIDAGISVRHPLEGSEGLFAGWVFKNLGRYQEAHACFAKTLMEARQLYAECDYRLGHPSLAVVLQHTATQLWLLGEMEHSAALYHEAMRMNEQLFSASEYPRGHRQLMAAYSAWGNVLQREGNLEGAAEYFEKAHQIAIAQFPRSEYPLGHDSLALIWRDLGRLQRAQGHYRAALEYFQRAHHSYRSRYDATFPDGHLLLALTLSELGRTYAVMSNTNCAERFLRQSLAMRGRVFPVEDYPSGHPSLATSLRELGQFYIAMGKPEEAYELLARAARMEQTLARSFVGGASESLLLNLAARKFESLESLLEAWCESRRDASDVYSHVWERRGFVPRLIAYRQQALRGGLAGNSEGLYREYLDVRREISRALLISATHDGQIADARCEEIRRLNSRKEALESQLTDVLTNDTPGNGVQGATPEVLSRQLPAGSVFVDFVRFRRVAKAWYFGVQPGQTADLLAFVIAPGDAVKCVRLGDAEPIEELAQRWHGAISKGRVNTAGTRFYQSVWEPLHRLFPPGTHTVYIATDGALSLMPWNALPVPDSSRLLIEDYVIATVPHGEYLCAALTRSSSPQSDTGTLLAVGDLDYGKPPQDFAEITYGLKEVIWRALSGASVELQGVAAAAGERPVLRLTGVDATTHNVLEALPRCRWAHFATHGFFLDPSLRRRLRLAEHDVGQWLTENRNRHSVLQRNPFLHSGLALSLANEIGDLDELALPIELKGILTAEAIAAADCSGLDLVVLSACESGRGDVVHGDGVFGLQTAFHVAGARNVIGSLWKVDDRVTAQLMNRFYQHLWGKQLTPAAALRAAQLELVHQSARQPARKRGLELKQSVPLPAPVANAADPGIAPTQWAAFMLSGPGF